MLDRDSYSGLTELCERCPAISVVVLSGQREATVASVDGHALKHTRSKSGALSGSPMPPFYFPDTTIEREYEVIRPARAAPTVTLYITPTPPTQNRYDAR